MSNTLNRRRVSTGLPVHNGERYIGEALESLLRQTFEDFELIICDNASTDRTEQLCRSYAESDRRIHYVRNPTNLGAARNYRLAFERSSGEYFRWAAYDDVIAPDFLRRCVEVLDHDPSVVLAYPKTKLIDESGSVTSEYNDDLHLVNPRASQRFVQLSHRLGLCNAVYGLVRPEVLRRTAGLGAYIASDASLLAELTLYGKFWEVPEFLFYRRLHSAAYSSQKVISQLLEFHDPKLKRRIPLTTWRHLFANLLAVRRAPVSTSEKMRLCYFLLRRAIWTRGNLARELSTLVRRGGSRGVGLSF